MELLARLVDFSVSRVQTQPLAQHALELIFGLAQRAAQPATCGLMGRLARLVNFSASRVQTQSLAQHA
jgi:GTP cyclohydrolase I